MTTSTALELYNKAKGVHIRERQGPYLPEVCACVEALVEVGEMYQRLGGDGTLSRQVAAVVIFTTERSFRE